MAVRLDAGDFKPYTYPDAFVWRVFDMKKFFHKYAIWVLDVKSQMSLMVLNFVLMKPIVEGSISALISEEAGMLYSLTVLAFNVFNMCAVKYGSKIKDADKKDVLR